MTSKKRTWPRRKANPLLTSSGGGVGEPGKAGTTRLSPHPIHPIRGKEASRFYHDAEGRTDGSRVDNRRPPPLNSSDVFGGTLKGTVDTNATCQAGEGSGTRQQRGDGGHQRARDPPDKPLRDDVGLDSQLGRETDTSTGGTL